MKTDEMARIYKYLALIAILPIAAPQCTLEKSQEYFRRSVHEFSVELLRRIAEETDSHFIASTLSPYTLLSAVSLGASEETLAEIITVLKHHKHICFRKKYLELAQLVFSQDESATLERSGVVFVDERVELKDAFRRELTATKVCEVTPLNFEDYQSAALSINDFVRSATHGVIEDIVSPADLVGVYLMLVDAMYFKGTWRNSFAAENTQRAPFYDTYNNVLGEVNMMYLKTDLNVTDFDPIGATVVELPYGEQGRFSMMIFLPHDGVNLMDVITKLKNISLTSVFGQFRRQAAETVSLQLPRFKLTSDLSNLKELLFDMGLKEMFDPNLAKFPLLSEYELYVSTVVQKADVEVTEEGTVAAAVTELGFSSRSAMLNLEIVLNKPFMFMIVDRIAEVAVFSGAYSKPSLY